MVLLQRQGAVVFQGAAPSAVIQGRDVHRGGRGVDDGVMGGGVLQRQRSGRVKRREKVLLVYSKLRMIIRIIVVDVVVVVNVDARRFGRSHGYVVVIYTF